MKKIFIIIILLCLDLTLFLYLSNINKNRNTYIFKMPEIKYLIQLNDIKLNDIKEFDFDKYFSVIGFNNEYVYTNDEEFIYISLDNINEYKFKYELIKPEVIEKVIYRDVEIPTVKEETVESSYFYVDSNRLEFSKDTDLDSIRSALINNLHTTYQTNIDYSRLNVSHIGQYSVFYISEIKKIEIIVEII